MSDAALRLYVCAVAAAAACSCAQVVMSRLLDSRRLVLVLDLDHTLVNSVKFSEVDPEWEYKLEQTVAEQVRHTQQHLASASFTGS